MSLMFVATLATAIVSSSVAHKVSGAVFVQRPQNHTLNIDSKKPFILYCSVDIASEDGMDWIVQINGVRERVCSSKDFYINGSKSCLLNYSMDVPNNRTLNLIVDPQIASLGDKYCCQFDNGAGKKSCSFLTISHVPVAVTLDPAGGITGDTEFTDTATVVYDKNIAESKMSPDNSVVLIVVGVTVGILVMVVAASACLILRKRRSNNDARSKVASGNEAATPLKEQEGHENQNASAVQNGACL